MAAFLFTESRSRVLFLRQKGKGVVVYLGRIPLYTFPISRSSGVGELLMAEIHTYRHTHCRDGCRDGDLALYQLGGLAKIA